MNEKFKANPSAISCIITGTIFSVVVGIYFYYFYPLAHGLWDIVASLSIIALITFMIAMMPLLSKDLREQKKIKRHMLELFRPPHGYQLKYEGVSDYMLHQERDNWYHMYMQLNSNEGPWDDEKSVNFYFNTETERTK